MLKQYDCKDITKKNSKEYAQIMNLMQPAIMVANMGKDPKIHQIVDTLEVFITNIGKLMAVFNEEDERSDFCNGAIFGMNGSDMLIKVSQSVLQSGSEGHKHKESGEIDLEEEEPEISQKADLKGKVGKAGKHHK